MTTAVESLAPQPESALVVALSQPPQETPDAIDLLYAELGEKLGDALDHLVGKPLARFAWRSRAASGGGGQVDVTLQKVNRSTRSGAAQLVLEFRCESKGGSTVVVPMTFSPFRQTKQGTLSYRLQFGGNFRHWECARTENGELFVETAFTRPIGLAALEHFGAVWFGGAQEASKRGVASGVERVGNAILNDLVAAFWPRFQVGAKKREWGLARAPSLLQGDAIRINADEWAAGTLVFCLWSLLLRTLSEPEEAIAFDALVSDSKGLPPASAYWPRRSVDLMPPQVQQGLHAEGLSIPWHVIEAACAALNAGKHVIFTGPPGCGKSKLAGVLAALATGRDPLMVTASPAWTSGDLLGRYFPRRDGAGLEFKPGSFLRAIDEGNRWLVIDEFNRANIDECFGELFSVLADDVVELPFEEELGDAVATGPSGTAFGPVRILPARRGPRSTESTTHTNTVDYVVGPAFRLIGTMNDADRSSLHQLSFALLRRFHIIRVEAPPAADVQKVIDRAIHRAGDELMLDTLAYRLTRKGKRASSLELDMIRTKLTELFARDLGKRKDQSYTDLVQERVVGLATVQDIIRFVAEGIRGSSQGKDANQVSTDELTDDLRLDDHAQATCASFLAIAVALSVFPQLDALTPAARLAAVKHIVNVFQPNNETPLLMHRVEAGTSEEGTYLKLALIRHTEPTQYDFDGDCLVSIAEFLVEELSQQYRDADEATVFLDLLRAGRPAKNA